LIQIDGLILTDRFANTTFLLFNVKTAFIDISDQGNGLGEIDMDGFVLRYFLIKSIRVFDRAVFYTGRTARAFVLKNISGLFSQGYLEVSCFPVYAVNFSVRQDLYVGMPADLDQFGREYSDGAVVGRKGLVKLGHVAPNGRCLVDQVNLKTRRGKIERGLNSADPSTHNHDVSKITLPETLTKLFNLFFFHFSMSFKEITQIFDRRLQRFKEMITEIFLSNRCNRIVIAVIRDCRSFQKSPKSLPAESP
jgi:hypothetical protein